jgi:predicted lipoprotein with Yx(FWY)xxD motif
MKRKQTRVVLVLAVALVASVGLIACGGDDDETTTAAETTTENAAAGGGGGAGAAQVDVDDNSELGQILVDGDGMTLYLFEKDTSADASTCSGECAKAWPPLTTKGEPRAGSGVDASSLTTFTRDDGTTQVAYGDWPLYYYAGDQAPGDITGNDLDQFGAEWFAVTPSGDSAGGGKGHESESENESESESGGDSSSSGGSSGYGY